MAKKRGGGRKMRQEDDYDSDDASSMVSMDRSEAASDSFYDTYTQGEGDEEAIDEAVEELTEKRLTTRVAALEKLTSFLLQYLPPDAISESFVSNVLACLRKPSEKEAVLGCRMLATMGLVFGGDEERFYQRSLSVLEPMIKTARIADVKVASIRALAIICIVCSVEEENLVDFMSLLEKYFDAKIHGSICTSALEAWSLLASSLPDSVVAGEDYIGRYLPLFIALLEHSDVEARSAAAESIALIYESAQREGVTLVHDEELTARCEAMSKESSKKNSKKDRKTQRLVFRDVYATLANGESPHMTFAVKNEVHDVSGWGSIRQYEAIRVCLGTGLQHHLKYNNCVRQMLDLPETLEERVMDRRDVFDKKSYANKQRSNMLKGDRRRKQNLQDSFFEEDYN